MKFKKMNWLEVFLINLDKQYRVIHLIIATIILPGIYFLVYYTGGIKYPYSHMMYLLILFVAVSVGTRFGLLFGIVGGLLLGPLMPLDTITQEPQQFTNWVFRMVVFTISGGFIGFTTDLLRSNLRLIRYQFTNNIETDIPNIYSLENMNNKRNQKAKKSGLITVLINNHDIIMDLFSKEIYLEIIKKVYERLKQHCPNAFLIIQADDNKFWIATPINDKPFDYKTLYLFLRKPYEINDIPLYVDFSVGIDTTDKCDDCLKVEAYSHADIAAKYAFKTNSHYSVFESSMLMNRLDLELVGMFPNALLNKETSLVFQPIVDLKTLKPVGLEALIRWDHPRFGRIMPDKFIPLIEETQYIHLLTNWVIYEAVKKIKEFEIAGIDIKISINVSAKNLTENSFLVNLVNMVQKFNIKPSQIEIEITESLLINIDNKDIIKRIKEAGFKMLLDDFGKGYSSLAYLSQYQFDIIKVDRYFIQQMQNNIAAESVVKSIIELSHRLKALVVAEGIENAEDANLIRQLSCDYGQGYYFARPIESKDIISWYKNQM